MKTKKSELTSSQMVRKRNKIYGPDWRKENARKAGKARWAKKTPVDKPVK